MTVTTPTRRDCLRWLGATPSRLRQSPALLATLAQLGYG